jgi:EAL domain-containing protein (putative c-di-GMP-specific phosphodiesterase class I)
MLGEKILARLALPYTIAEQNYYCTSSIGAVLYHRQETSSEELLKQADIAMYQAKASGRNTLRFFDPQMQICINARVAMEADLRLALAENQFQLYYQLQIKDNRQATGAEVLLRWIHPTRGMVSPADFIPLAEESGLIVSIGAWVLETACAQLKRWENDEQMQHLQLAVNVSAKQFHQVNFVEQVSEILTLSAIKPKRLKLELTESLVLDNVDETIQKMDALRKLGVRFSMDDFGTGYSSLAYLTQLPLDQLKIDQSFVRNLGLKPSDAVIVQTIIGMANNLGIDVIAEGVETAEQCGFLQQHGCLQYQGYFFSKPVPLDLFEKLIR